MELRFPSRTGIYSVQTVLELKRAIHSSLIKQKCAIPSTINANSAKLVALETLCTSLGY